MPDSMTFEDIDLLNKNGKYEELRLAYTKLAERKDDATDRLLLRLLETGEFYHVLYSCELFSKNERTNLIPVIKGILAQLPPRKGLSDYRDIVRRLIDELENHHSGAECHCNLYDTGGGFGNRYTPGGEVDHGFVIKEKEIVHQEEYYTEYYCKCLHCGRRWLVTDEIGYHYPLYCWTELK